MYATLLDLNYATLLIPVKDHYIALKEALRKDGLASLLHPQKIRDAATADFFIKTCKFPCPQTDYLHGNNSDTQPLASSPTKTPPSSPPSSTPLAAKSSNLAQDQATNSNASPHPT